MTDQPIGGPIERMAVSPVIQPPAPTVAEIVSNRRVTPKLSFNLLLIFLRAVATVAPLYLSVTFIDWFWEFPVDFVIWLSDWGFTVSPMIAFFMEWFPRLVVVLMAGFVNWDIGNSIQMLADWEVRNRYRLGKYVGFKKKGLALKWPLFETWGRVIDLRLRIARVRANKAFSRDNVPGNWEFVTHHRVNPQEPWRAETDVEDIENFTLSAEETTVREVTGNMNFEDISSKREQVDEQLLMGITEKINRPRVVGYEETPSGEMVPILESRPIVIVDMLALSDTEVPPAVEEALSQQAADVATARGREASAEYEAQAAENFVTAAQIYKNAGAVEPTGQIAQRLRGYSAIREVAGEKGTTTVLPQLADLGIGGGGLEQALSQLGTTFKEGFAGLAKMMTQEGQDKSKN